MLSQHPTRVLGFIVAVYFVFAGTYAVVTPMFESPDEPAHFEYVRYVALHRALPIEPRPEFPDHLQTAGHPPLYYALGALAAGWVNLAEYKPLRKNPYFSYGPDSLGANVFQHSSAEAFPWQGIPLAVHLLRGMSILMGAGTIVATYRLGRVLFPEEVTLSLLAAATLAFVPQFIFISASVNSDSLVNLLSAVAMVEIAQIARNETRIACNDTHIAYNEMRFPRDVILLGITVGLAVLAKASALVLVPLALAGIIWASPRAWRLWLRGSIVFLIAFAVTAGWWFVRNLLLFGDPLALRWWEIAYASARRTAPLAPGEIPSFLTAAWISFWGNFGWGNLNADDWVYIALAVASAAAVIGLGLRRVRRDPAPRGFWLLIGDVGAVAVLFAWYYNSFPEGGSQGRYMFTALPAIAILLVYGWSAFLPSWRGWIIPGTASAGLCLASALVPLMLLHPAYKPFTPPPPLTLRDIPHTAIPAGIRFGGIMDVVAYAVTPDTCRRGETANVRVYWRALERPRLDYKVRLELVGKGGELLWARERRPGRGRSPADLWERGDVIADLFVVRVPPEAQTGAAGLLLSVHAPDGTTLVSRRGGEAARLATLTIE